MENSWFIVTAVALLLTGIAGFAWLFRVRGVRRWLAALDIYAEREIERETANGSSRGR